MKRWLGLVGVLFLAFPPKIFATNLETPTELQVQRYAEGETPDTAYVTFFWHPVPGATSYNLFTVGSNDIFFEGIPSNIYTLKFNPHSTWYFKASAVDQNGQESAHSDVLTISYPNFTTSLPVPQNLRVTQVETTGVPGQRKAHIFWDPIPGISRFALYTSAGSSYSYYADVDTNLYELYMSDSSTFYVAVAAVDGNHEGRKSAVLTVDASKDPSGILNPTPKVTPAPRIPTPSPTPRVTPRPATPPPAATDEQIQKLRALEQDVKTLQTQVDMNTKAQQKQMGLLEKITEFLQRIFGRRFTS